MEAFASLPVLFGKVYSVDMVCKGALKQPLSLVDQPN